MATRKRRYNLTLPKGLDASLEELSQELDVPKSEVLRRALELFNHAMKADGVYLSTGDEQQRVILR